MTTGMNTNPRSWLDGLFGVAVTLVVSGLLLQWAWRLLRPLLPIGLVLVVGYLAVVKWQRR